LDLRRHNTWVTEACDVDLNELAEVYIINSIAPYVLATSLKPLLEKNTKAELSSASSKKSSASSASNSVGSNTTPHHTPCETPTETPESSPTNSFTIGRNYSNSDKRNAKSNKFETSETSWIINVTSMEGVFNWKYKSSRHPHTNMAKAALNMFTRTCGQYFITSGIVMVCVDTGWNNSQTPLSYDIRTPVDCVDGAARILDPIYRDLKQFGILYKDFEQHAW
jgi:NAD(P)-dependent dehydrogenase (short-subunit alcohol dehydrogenase family)